METKYTEPFTPTVFPASRYESLPAYQAAGFRRGAAHRLQGPGTNQLWRNLLLAAATRANDGFGAGHVVVLAGEDDRAADRAVAAARAELVDPDRLLRSLTLERLVEVCLPEWPLADWAAGFRRRYLDLSPVASPRLRGPAGRTRTPVAAAAKEQTPAT